jgi:tRNA-dihydrouridine synthase 2
MDYRDKLILAPMVRVGTLPMRLLALEYGADLVYTEEIIDWKLSKTERRENKILGTVDFRDLKDGNIIFRTCERERGKVILQIGTANPERALETAKHVEKDVAGIDVNMGCPKEFSVKGGMGVALMANLENAKKVLETLVQNLEIPVTCKIRILSTAEETIRVVQELEKTGIKAIGIHGRTREERPQHPYHADVIRAVAGAVGIPVIANGGSREISKHPDIYKFKEECGASSVMLARASGKNCSIFRKEGLVPMEELILAYLKLSVDYDNPPHNSKYCIQGILGSLQDSELGKRFLEAQTLEQICDVWGMKDYCKQKQQEYLKKGMLCRRDIAPPLTNGNPPKKQKTDDPNLIEKNIAFIRANYQKDTDLPKSVLHLHALKVLKSRPSYETEQHDKLFRSTLSLNGKKYTSLFWEKNKKFSEQGAALVCLQHLGLVSDKDLIENGSMSFY